MSTAPAASAPAATLGVMPRRKTPTKLYDYAAIAEATGIRPAVLRVWNARARMPEADFLVGQSPAWLPATIEPWIREQAKAPKGS